jgi:hypothetical protein
MQTNKTIPLESELGQKGKALLAAAYEYWKAYQKELGSTAVVWLDDDSGHFVLFTRGEYRDAIMNEVPWIAEEKHLVHPFEKD